MRLVKCSFRCWSSYSQNCHILLCILYNYYHRISQQYYVNLLFSLSKMGVSWVFEHEKTAKEVERLLEGGGAEQIGTFTVDCLPYIPNDKLQSCIQHNYVLHHSNFPQSSFSIG
ncbi:hypothetical protein OESDEN_02506 [Oesophagostomum dentatum]|uniref:Mediator of RNA polymerase II transcription subunit 20 n=1 Tax=Oesophagostomum dentatum TaxID=61180 RepID=A0A0B1TIZ0_OESDE|nr:hypothetical protein OESDEN_02506 [Oesophagostomum dentatum]